MEVKQTASVIDSHQHFWKYDPKQHSWITDDMKAIRKDFQPADLKVLLDANGVDGCVTVQVDQTEDETLRLLTLANQNDFIKGVVGWIDLRNKNLATRLEYFSTLKTLKGFRHIVQGEGPGFLAQPAFIHGVNMLSKYDFTYDLLVYHHQLAEALTFVRQVPETRIVIDHIAKPSIRTGDINAWKQSMTAMAESPNVYCKISGMVTEAQWPGWLYEHLLPYLDVVFKVFGPDRLMYGSDWPVCLVAASYEQQFSVVTKYLSALPESEKKQVLGENAKRFYKL